ncbi:MAG: NAD-dependent epimerase [Fimbriimonadaceae bacterium]|nr:NAD-dependent epimerase [Fimbriimonadaceae bacterium]
MQNILVTGSAGFIGFHVAKRLLHEGCRVVGLDNFNDYYDPTLKEARSAILEGSENFISVRGGLEDPGLLDSLIRDHKIEAVINLAAQAGVRYSLQNPHAYAQSNLVGFVNLLEACRQHEVKHLVYASSSSVYGANTKYPFSVHDNVDHPISLYAATKKSNELMAHTYSHLFALPTTGLRFFTVYGPWGRPDMAAFLFTKAILEGKPIDVYNNGKMQRDFTFIDDIAEGVVRVMRKPAEPNPEWDSSNPDPGSGKAPYRIYNIGNNRPTELLKFIQVLETALGRKAEMNMLPMQPGDVPATAADISGLQWDVGFEPSTPIEVGIPKFVAWYRQFYSK